MTRLAAYPTGFEFDLVTMSAEDQTDFDPLMFHHHRLQRGASDEIPPEMLRLGVQFADGSKATNTGVFTATASPRPGRSCMPAEAEAAVEAGARRSGCGHYHHPVRSRWSANGPR